VALQIAELRGCVKRSTLKEQLRSLPLGLDETYDRILLRVPAKHRQDVKRLLELIALSARAMTVAEIADILVVDFTSKDTPTCDITGRLRRPEDVLTLLSCLVVVSTGRCLFLACLLPFKLAYADIQYRSKK